MAPRSRHHEPNIYLILIKGLFHCTAMLILIIVGYHAFGGANEEGGYLNSIDYSFIRRPILESIEESPRIGHIVPSEIGESINKDKAERKSLFGSAYEILGNSSVLAARDINFYKDGVDRKPYASNAFLLRFSPFSTDEIWMPMQVVSMRLNYAFDKDLFGGRQEVWLTSRQAFRLMRGDCEDHAILLADWMIELGFDARVAIGNWKGDGHAWVVLFHEGKEYLLEATDKFSKRIFPLARFKGEYEPYYMFNQDYFWKNTGSGLTTKYSGKYWLKTSEFQEEI